VGRLGRQAAEQGISAGRVVQLYLSAARRLWQDLPAPSGAAGETAFGVQQFSVAFLNEYWLHFELISVLLVVAVVAALAVIKVGRRDHG